MFLRNVGDWQHVLSAGVSDEEAKILRHAEDGRMTSSANEDRHKADVRIDDLKLSNLVEQLVQFGRRSVHPVVDVLDLDQDRHAARGPAVFIHELKCPTVVEWADRNGLAEHGTDLP